MNSLYLLLDAAVLAGPICLSFDTKVKFYSNWRRTFLATLIVAFPFLIWDWYFTEIGVWGFNDDYLTGLKLLNLPIEEVLFFIVVPFACVFIYECCNYYLIIRNTQIIDWITRIAVGLYILVIIALNPSGIYTIVVSITGLIVLLYWTIFSKQKHLGMTFLLAIIPFLGMNGCLTGAFTENPIVWYQPGQHVIYRIFTIPLEDVVYGMSLILLTLFVYDSLPRTTMKKKV